MTSYGNEGFEREAFTRNLEPRRRHYAFPAIDSSYVRPGWIIVEIPVIGEAVSNPIIGIPAHTETVNGVKSYGVRATYTEAVRCHGGVPMLLTPVGPDVVHEYVEAVDGLLVPGGTDVDSSRYGEERHPALMQVDPDLDTMELELVRRAYDSDLPTLAICRGIQSIAVALGGSLIQDLPSQHQGLRHEVRENGRQFLAHEMLVQPDSKIAGILERETVAVNSFHHQAVKKLPPSLVASGWSEDGLIEAAEAPDKRFLIGVQCHPEELWATVPEFHRLFSKFIAACLERKLERTVTGVV